MNLDIVQNRTSGRDIGKRHSPLRKIIDIVISP